MILRYTEAQPHAAFPALSTLPAELFRQTAEEQHAWRLEKVDEFDLSLLTTWGQVSTGRLGGASLAVATGGGAAFEIELPSATAAARWREAMRAAAEAPAAAGTLQNYLARGRRGGISGLTKAGWVWCERGKAGSGRWRKMWMELDPEGELRLISKKTAGSASGSVSPSSSPVSDPSLRLGSGWSSGSSASFSFASFSSVSSVAAR